MNSKRSVGYIGLGNIGKPSAERLIGESLNAHVFDVYRPAVDELVEKGAIGCDSPADLAYKCEHIGICVRDDHQVEQLLYGEAGNDHDAAPLRFELPRTGHAIDVGHFSRRRQINPDSSFSVLG